MEPKCGFEIGYFIALMAPLLFGRMEPNNGILRACVIVLTDPLLVIQMDVKKYTYGEKSPVSGMTMW
jgi:hypothetical protein